MHMNIYKTTMGPLILWFEIFARNFSIIALDPFGTVKYLLLQGAMVCRH